MKKSDQILRFSSGNNVTHVISFVFFRLEIHTRTIEIQLFSSRFFSVYIVANFSGRNIRKFLLKRSIRVSFDPFRSVAFRHGVSWSRERWRSPFPTENAKKTVGRNPARERWVTSERFMGFYTLLGRTISSSRFIDSFASFLRHFSFQLIAPSAINFIKLNR